MIESFDCLTKESISFMHSHGVFQPLVKIVLIKNCMEQITLDKEIENNIIKNFKIAAGIKDEASLNSWLEENNIEKKDFEGLALQKIKKATYSHQNFAHKVEKKFLERKNNLDIVVYSLLRVEDPFLARELYFRLVGNEASFGELAKAFSKGIERKTRGLIGPIELAKTHPKLIEILRNSTPGVVQPPSEVEGLYVVTRLESLDESKLDKLMRENMEEELFNEWIESESKTLVFQMLEKHKLEEISKLS
tara:strand:- start:2133 stop:2879 length:747 start_codon:yes stop_codon:yes gene_type:complete